MYRDDGPEWAPAQFRILVHCLQSSGCTYFMAILGQSAAVVTALDVAINSEGVPARAQDVVVREDAFPRLSGSSANSSNSSSLPATIVVAKVPIWGLHEEDPIERLRRLQRQFKPHATLLFIRHPVDNLLSLNKHLLSKRTHHPGYALSHGDPASKLDALERLWKKRDKLFSGVIYYGELFLDRPGVLKKLQTLRRPGDDAKSVNLPVDDCSFCCLNAVRDIVADTKSRLRYRVSWGAGGISHLSPAAEYKHSKNRKGDALSEVKSLSPSLLHWSDNLEKKLAKKPKAASRWSEGDASFSSTRGEDFILACADAEATGVCKPQKPHVPHPSTNKEQHDVVSPNHQRRGAKGIANMRGKLARQKPSNERKVPSQGDLPFTEETAHTAGVVLIFGLLTFLARCGHHSRQMRGGT